MKRLLLLVILSVFLVGCVIESIIEDKKPTQPPIEDPIDDPIDDPIEDPIDDGGDEEEDTVPPPEPDPVYYTVTFNTVLGFSKGSEPYSIEVLENTTIPTQTNPVKSGFRDLASFEPCTFQGWFDSDFTTEWSIESDVVTSDIMLYAKWSYANYVLGQEIQSYKSLGGGNYENPNLIIIKVNENYLKDGWKYMAVTAKYDTTQEDYSRWYFQRAGATSMNTIQERVNNYTAKCMQYSHNISGYMLPNNEEAKYILDYIRTYPTNIPAYMLKSDSPANRDITFYYTSEYTSSTIPMWQIETTKNDWLFIADFDNIYIWGTEDWRELNTRYFMIKKF